MHNFAYLTLPQRYVCHVPGSSDPYEIYTAEEAFCTPEMEHLDCEVDQSYEYYMTNWFTQMDIKCMAAA